MNLSWVTVWGAIGFALVMSSCSPKPASGPARSGEKAEAIETMSSESSETNEAGEANNSDAGEATKPTSSSGVETISLAGDAPVKVPNTTLRAHISGSFHKTRAPLVGVSVLVENGAGEQAEVSWRIESGQIDSTWLAIEGRRFDEPSSSYVEEELPGWQVRLDSVDAHSAGGDPKAITVSFRRIP